MCQLQVSFGRVGEAGAVSLATMSVATRTGECGASASAYAVSLID